MSEKAVAELISEKGEKKRTRAVRVHRRELRLVLHTEYIYTHLDSVLVFPFHLSLTKLVETQAAPNVVILTIFSRKKAFVTDGPSGTCFSTYNIDNPLLAKPSNSHQRAE